MPSDDQAWSSVGQRVGLALVLVNLLVAALGVAAGFAAPAPAHADVVAYLVKVTVRPGYNFANADQAIIYGEGICEKVKHGEGYANIVADVKTDFSTSDQFQAPYLIAQAGGELCPAQIWGLRNSAAGYRPPPA